jgi:uracil-DNA glycosylase family 4
MRKELETCNLCPRRCSLQEGLTPIQGIGAKNADYMIILSSPSLKCHFQRTNLDFLEEKTLNQILKETDIVGKVYITNLVKCYSEKKKISEIKICVKNYLEREIAIVSPKKIFACFPKSIKHNWIECPTLHEVCMSTKKYNQLIKVIKDNVE